MGLGICVGGLADNKDDPEVYQGQLEMFEQINSALARAGLPPHQEPEIPLVWSFGTGYSSIHYLRRLAAHLWATAALPPPSPAGEDPAQDRTTRRYSSLWGMGPLGLFSGLGRWLRKGRSAFEHLMMHSDAEGFYLPIDSQEVIFDDVPGAMIGSSYRLKEECASIAASLELPLDLDLDIEDEDAWKARIPSGRTLDRYPLESGMCLALYQASCHSIRTGAAIRFG